MLRDTPETDFRILPLTQAEGAFACAPRDGTSAADLNEIREGIIIEAANAQAKRARVSLLLEYLLFMMIPIAGIVIAAIWAFSDRGDALRRNLARAMFIATVIMLVLYLLIALVLAPYFTDWLYGEWQEYRFWREDDGWAPPPQNSRAPEGSALGFRVGISGGR